SMGIMKRILPITILLGGLIMTSCVSNKKYAALDTQYKDLGQLYQKTQMELTESRAKVKSLEDQLEYERKNNAALKEAYAKLQATLDQSIAQNSQGNVNISKLVDEINASNKYIQHLVNTKNKSDSLN